MHRSHFDRKVFLVIAAGLCLVAAGQNSPTEPPEVSCLVLVGTPEQAAWLRQVAPRHVTVDSLLLEEQELDDEALAARIRRFAAVAFCLRESNETDCRLSMWWERIENSCLARVIELPGSICGPRVHEQQRWLVRAALVLRREFPEWRDELDSNLTAWAKSTSVVEFSATTSLRVPVWSSVE